MAKSRAAPQRRQQHDPQQEMKASAELHDFFQIETAYFHAPRNEWQ
jgi:hypothetical protein